MEVAGKAATIVNDSMMLRSSRAYEEEGALYRKVLCWSRPIVLRFCTCPWLATSQYFGDNLSTKAYSAADACRCMVHC